MQGNIVNGQWVQYSTCGTTLYATVLPPAAGTTRLQVYFQTTPATNVTWSFQGDAVDANIPGYKQQSSGNFYLCTTAAGGGGTSAAPYLYVNTGAFDYGTPTGCADGVSLALSCRAVQGANYLSFRLSTTTTVPPPSHKHVALRTLCHRCSIGVSIETWDHHQVYMMSF
jgi:hypothetical protein